MFLEEGALCSRCSPLFPGLGECLWAVQPCTLNVGRSCLRVPSVFPMLFSLSESIPQMLRRWYWGGHCGCLSCIHSSPLEDHLFLVQPVDLGESKPHPWMWEQGTGFRPKLTHIIESLILCIRFLGCRTNYHEPGGLRQKRFIFSELRSPEVQHQVINRAVLPVEALG